MMEGPEGANTFALQGIDLLVFPSHYDTCSLVVSSPVFERNTIVGEV